MGCGSKLEYIFLQSEHLGEEEVPGTTFLKNHENVHIARDFIDISHVTENEKNNHKTQKSVIIYFIPKSYKTFFVHNLSVHNNIAYYYYYLINITILGRRYNIYIVGGRITIYCDIDIL